MERLVLEIEKEQSMSVREGYRNGKKWPLCPSDHINNTAKVKQKESRSSTHLAL